MHDVETFAIVVLVAAGALWVAAASSRIGERVGVPAPAIFLLGASVAAWLRPGLGSLSIVADQRIVTVALVLILFDGGMHIGRRRFREAAGAIAWIGVAGTFVTAAGLALAAHYLFGFDWRPALLIGTALAPTDPAVVFSVLGRREIAGRSGTLLEGESGANDPVGIALMIAILGTSGSAGWSAFGHGVGTFALQMAVGLAFGLAGTWVLRWVMRRLPMPNEALYSVRTVAFALLLYGAAAACHGSGFLAVFVAGIGVGDERAPYKREIERFVAATASLGEIVAFVVLGLSIPITDAFGSGAHAWTGVGLAAVLIFLVRPVLVGALLTPVRLRLGERAFVLWAGLKGAVPILLGTFVLTGEVADGRRIYAVVFVVVLISVVVQGGLVPVLGRVWGVPMRVVEPEPWSVGLRFQHRPDGLRRFVVQAGSPAEGCAVRELPVGEDVWISLLTRGGRLVQVRGDTVLRPGDEVLVLTDDGAEAGSAFHSPVIP